MLTEKWTSIKQGIDKDKCDKKEVVDQHIQRIEILLN